MNENSHIVALGMFLPDKQGWGARAGAQIRGKLSDYIAARPGVGVFKVSMQGMKRVDVAFAAQAIIALAADHRSKQPICVIDLSDDDLRSNLEAAACQLKVPLMAWHGTYGEALGLRPGSSAHQALAFILKCAREVRSAKFAGAAGISISNASWRFNRLWASGLLLRAQGTASSGGIEHVYRPVM